MNRINLNSDMGESYGRWQRGSDTELMQYIPTINVACGFTPATRTSCGGRWRRQLVLG